MGQPVRQKPEVSFEVAPLGGIQFLGSAGTLAGDFDVGFSSVWGVEVSAHIPGIVPQLSYTFQPTSLTLSPPFGSDQKLFSMSVHHILAGVATEFPVSRVVRLFIGIAVGMGIFAPHAENVSDEVRFASAIYAGSHFAINDRTGIHLEGRVVSSFFDSGSAVFCSVGGVCTFGIFDEGVTQLGFMVGPTFRF